MNIFACVRASLIVLAMGLTIGAAHAQTQTATQEPVNADGAAGDNTLYEAGTSQYWFIEEQRYGDDYIERGIAQENPALISEGLLIFNWGFAREASDGSFPGSGDGTPGEVEHSASLFIEAAARSLYALKHYSPVTYSLAPGTYTATIARDAQLIHQTAEWLTGATDSSIPTLLQQYDAPYTHRRYLLGAALQETSDLSGDSTLVPIADTYVDEGLALELGTGWQAALTENSSGAYPPAVLVAPGSAVPSGATSVISAVGVNPESNGYDANYQAVGAFYAECFYNYSSDTTRKAEIKSMLSTALIWEASRVEVNGYIDWAGSSRVGVEADLTGGGVKQISPMIVRDACLNSLTIADKTAVRVAGNRVNQYFKAVSVTPVAADGAAQPNAAWEAGTASTWDIGEQRFAADWIDAGIACENDSYIQEGLLMYNWGWARQLSDGSFGTTTSARFATAEFVEAAARSILALRQYNATEYASTISSFIPKITLSVNWLANNPTDVMASVEDYPSHCFAVAAAYAESEALNGNKALLADAVPYMQQGLSLVQPNGEMPEDGAADPDWQGIAILYAEWYLPYCANTALTSEIDSMISSGLTWEATNIDVNGDYDGSVATQPIYNAFANGATITGNKAFQVVANRIDNLYTTSP